MRQLIYNGIAELIVLSLTVLTLVINELFSGVNAYPLGTIRRVAQVLVFPLMLLFGVLVFIRLTNNA